MQTHFGSQVFVQRRVFVQSRWEGALPQKCLLAPKVRGLPQKAFCTTGRGTADEDEPRFKTDDAIV